jgi:hypothetical protein
LCFNVTLIRLFIGTAGGNRYRDCVETHDMEIGPMKGCILAATFFKG